MLSFRRTLIVARSLLSCSSLMLFLGVLEQYLIALILLLSLRFLWISSLLGLAIEDLAEASMLHVGGGMFAADGSYSVFK